MKKSKFKDFMKRARRILLAFIMLFVCLMTAACDEDAEEGSNLSKSMYGLDGVTVLYRPHDYDYSAAVGEGGDVNYYNKIAYEILLRLYNIYGIYNYGNDDNSDILGITTPDTWTAVKTNFNANDENKQYFYDAIRYSISEIEIDIEDFDDDWVEGIQTVKVNFDNSWNWTLPYKETTINPDDSNNYDNYLYKYGTDRTFTSKDYEFDYYIEDGSVPEEWYSRIQKNQKTKFEISTYYTNITSAYQNAFVSPTTDAEYEEKGFYEGGYVELLEYAIYKLVLGYTNEQIAEEIKITKDANGVPVLDTNGNLDIKVNDKPIKEALEQIKQDFYKLGSYVGLTTDENCIEGEISDVQKVADFITEVVIGRSSVSSIKVSEIKNGSTINLPDVVINRDYENVVKNIISFAATQTAIGVEWEYDEEGNKIPESRNPTYINEPYMAAAIKYYEKNNFLVDEAGEGHEVFKDIPYHEYQSVVFMFDNLNLAARGKNGRTIEDIHLCFEYDDYDTTDDKVCADSLSININFRYYDSTAGILYQLELTEGDGKVIVNKGEYDADAGHYMFSFSPFTIVNRALDLPVLKLATTPITINGTTEFKDYYHLNKSQSYGYYGSLNEEVIKRLTNSESGNDYFEICFDVDKTPGDTVTDYNFKVGLWYLG